MTRIASLHVLALALLAATGCSGSDAGAHISDQGDSFTMLWTPPDTAGRAGPLDVRGGDALSQDDPEGRDPDSRPDGPAVAADSEAGADALGGDATPDAAFPPDGPAEVAAELAAAPKDSDGDGLPDDVELAWGTNPYSPDTDGDGANDGLEVQKGWDPHSPDTDEDGLTDGQELTFGTDPLKEDSDEDGLTDGEETSQWGTNPAHPDSDGDGLPDGDEVAIGFDPLAQDSDSDGVADSGEPAGLVCGKANLAMPQFVQNDVGKYTLAVHQGAVVTGLLPPQPGMSAYVLDYPWPDSELAGFIASFPPPQLQTDVEMIAGWLADQVGLVCPATVRATGTKTHSFDGQYDMKVGVVLDLSCGALQPPSEPRNAILAELLGIEVGQLPGLPASFGVPGQQWVLSYMVESRTAESAIAAAMLAPKGQFDDPDGMARLYVEDLVMGAALANYVQDATGATDFNSLDDSCEPFVGETARADFIWSVDNSGSMKNDQETVAANVPVFTGLLANSGIDYRLAVTYQTCSDLDKASMKAGLSDEIVQLVMWDEIEGDDDVCTATKSSPGPVNGNLCDGEFTTSLSQFQGCVLENFNGGGSEYTLSTGMMAIDRSLPRTAGNPKKLRPDATTILVVMTDEEEQAYESEMSWLGDDMPTNPEEQAELAMATDPYIAWLTKDPVNAKVFSLQVLPGSSSGEPAIGIYRVVQECGGFSGDLLQDDLLPALKEIIAAAVGYAAKIKLANPPIPMTIQVARAKAGQGAVPVPRSRVDGFEYVASTNGIVFHGSHVPAEGEEIVVSYLYWVP
jgi:hypothetical protein